MIGSSIVLDYFRGKKRQGSVDKTYYNWPTIGLFEVKSKLQNCVTWFFLEAEYLFIGHYVNI